MPRNYVASPNVVYGQSTRLYSDLNKPFISLSALNAVLKFIGKVSIREIERHTRALGRCLALEMKEFGNEIMGSQDASKRAPHIYVLKLLHPGWKDHFAKDSICISHLRHGVRVSFGFYNTKEDVIAFARSVKNGLGNGIPPI
jgi:selenocysteine lyase/cysteine desulfurase